MKKEKWCLCILRNVHKKSIAILLKYFKDSGLSLS